MVKFQTYKSIDEQVFHREAFSMLIPEGWVVSGGIIWRQHATMPGAVSFSARSPDGLFELNILPSAPYYWGQSMFPFGGMTAGSSYMGNEVRQPAANFLQYLEEAVLPRSGFGIRVVGSRKLPEMEAALLQENPAAFGCTVSANAGIAQLEYSHQGYTFAGSVTCGLVYLQMMYGQMWWMADKIIATRAPHDRMEEASGIFAVMLKSFTIDIQWFNLYLQYVQALTNTVLQDIYNAGVISRIISNTSNQISDMTRRSYERQQAGYDRVYQGISEGIRGVNSYYDPYKGYPMEFPSDYRYVYANPLGEYIMTNEAGYNPNVGSNLDWTLLNRT